MHTLYFIINILFVLLYICDGLDRAFEEKEKEEEILRLKEIIEQQNTGDDDVKKNS